MARRAVTGGPSLTGSPQPLRIGVAQESLCLTLDEARATASPF
jgi:hypothetical protein